MDRPSVDLITFFRTQPRWHINLLVRALITSVLTILLTILLTIINQWLPIVTLSRGIFFPMIAIIVGKLLYPTIKIWTLILAVALAHIALAAASRIFTSFSVGGLQNQAINLISAILIYAIALYVGLG